MLPMTPPSLRESFLEGSLTEPSLAASDRRPASKQSERRISLLSGRSLAAAIAKNDVVRVGLGMLLEEPTLMASFVETLLGGLSRAAAASLPSPVLPPARARRPRVAAPRRLRRRSAPTVPGCGALPALPVHHCSRVGCPRSRRRGRAYGPSSGLSERDGEPERLRPRRAAYSAKGLRRGRRGLVPCLPLGPPLGRGPT